VAFFVAVAAFPARTARRPRYGGTLRVEIGAVIQSLDMSAAATTAGEAAARAQIDALIYDRTNAQAAQPAAGPFRISAWEPGKRLALAANDDFPQGRPFVDAIEFTMGRTAKDRMLDMELGKTDFIEIPQDQTRRASDAGIRVSESKPDELLAILFAWGDGGGPSAAVREALAEAVDRATIVNFILQKTGEPAGGLLPQWMSGTAFLFSIAADAAGAKAHGEELRAQNQPPVRVALGYDSGDSVEETVAERIVVDAQAVGISGTARALQQGTAPGSMPAGFDARIVRWRIPSAQPGAAMENFLAAFPEVAASAGDACGAMGQVASADGIYKCERAIVDARGIVPLAFLPEVYGLSARVRDWVAPGPGGSWPLADVWLEGSAE